MENLLYTFVNEFAGAFTSLICYSRIGPDDMLHSWGIILGMTLLVFRFPALNPYLSTFMQFGPLWDTASAGSIVLKWFVAVAAQLTGAAAAGGLSNYLTKTYQHESLGGNYVYNRLPATSDAYIWLFDEMFAVAFLLLGLLHLTRSLEPAIIQKNGASEPTTIPVPLIMATVFLVVAITYAFPSAHQSFHMTLFFIVLGAGDAWGYRLGGGILGTLLALGYYHFYYHRYNNPAPETKYAQVVVEPSANHTNPSQLRLPGLIRRL
jgi:hypothetical protein